jgi:hypothetical protein
MKLNGCRQFGQRALTILRRIGLLIWRNQLKCRHPPRRKCRVQLRVRRSFSTLRPRNQAVRICASTGKAWAQWTAETAVPDLCHDWQSPASMGRGNRQSAFVPRLAKPGFNAETGSPHFCHRWQSLASTGKQAVCICATTGTAWLQWAVVFQPRRCVNSSG